jgi:hypothetical protein
MLLFFGGAAYAIRTSAESSAPHPTSRREMFVRAAPPKNKKEEPFAS